MCRSVAFRIYTHDTTGYTSDNKPTQMQIAIVIINKPWPCPPPGPAAPAVLAVVGYAVRDPLERSRRLLCEKGQVAHILNFHTCARGKITNRNRPTACTIDGSCGCENNDLFILSFPVSPRRSSSSSCYEGARRSQRLCRLWCCGATYSARFEI